MHLYSPSSSKQDKNVKKKKKILTKLNLTIIDNYMNQRNKKVYKHIHRHIHSLATW